MIISSISLFLITLITIPIIAETTAKIIRVNIIGVGIKIFSTHVILLKKNNPAVTFKNRDTQQKMPFTASNPFPISHLATNNIIHDILSVVIHCTWDVNSF